MPPRPTRRSPLGRALLRWTTTTDHKVIGNLYLTTAFSFSLFAGVLALLMRAIALGAAPARPLRDQDQVETDQREQHPGQQQDVQRVQPGDQVVPGELGAEREHADVRAHHRDRQHDALGDPEPRPGQQVVRQRVAGEAFGERQQEQRHADHPVELTGAAERAGEEDPQQMRADGGDEDQRRPVVQLPDQQSAPHVEADVQRRPVRLRHPYPVQRTVRTVVDDLRHRRGEEQGEPDAGQQQDDEAVEGELAQEEPPVVGEGLVQQAAPLVPREAGVQTVGDAPARGLDLLSSAAPECPPPSGGNRPSGVPRRQWAPRPPPPNEPLDPLLQRGRSFDSLGLVSWFLSS